jgi:chromate transporter
VLALACFVAVALLRLPLAWVLLVVGGSGGLWAARCLRRRAAQPMRREEKS